MIKDTTRFDFIPRNKVQHLPIGNYKIFQNILKSDYSFSCCNEQH